MDLITLIVMIVVLGVIMWAINTYIPMSAGIKQILNTVVIIALVIWLFQIFGLLSMLPHITIGK